MTLNEKFMTRMRDEKVRKDTMTVADFIQIYCDGNHPERSRAAVDTDASQLGVYGSRRPVVCEECEAHLAYAEKRRAFCDRDPKPFCAHCDSQCYKADELAWQHQMMRYSGPRSWRKGYAIEGVKHMLEARKWKREMARRAQAAATTGEDTSS